MDPDALRHVDDHPHAMQVSTVPELTGIRFWSGSSSTALTFISPSYFFAAAEPSSRSEAFAVARYDGRVREVRGGDVSLVPPGVVHVQLRANVFRAYAIDVDPAAIARYLDPALPTRRIARWRSGDRRLVAHIDAVAVGFRQPSFDVMEREHHLRAFLARAFELADDGPRRPAAKGCARAVRRAREIIEDRYDEPLSLTEIAEEVGLSVYHLERSFSGGVGAPIHRYLQLVRVRRAMTMLRSGVRPAEVWPACGFVDQSHMTRIFRSRLGFTPARYFAAR